MPDLPAAIAALPPGLCGVVFRHDAEPNRPRLAQSIARICRARRLALVIAGDPGLAASLGAGLHLRGGKRPGYSRPHPGRLRTASVHNAGEIFRARRAGADILFCSPVFPTASHPGAAFLGPLRFRALARLAGPARVYALGGIDGKTVRLLGKSCLGAGAIAALLRNPAPAQ